MRILITALLLALTSPSYAGMIIYHHPAAGGGSETRRPTGDGATTMIASAGSNFECVDETSPNDETDYIYQDSAAGYDRYSFSAFTLPSNATNIAVTIYAVFRTVAGDITYRMGLYVNGSHYIVTDTNDTGTYAEFSNTWNTNPDTSLAWTYQDINGAGSNPLQQFGVGLESMGAGEIGRCTQVYLVVTYD